MRHAISSSGAFVGPILVRLLSAPNRMIYAMASFARFRPAVRDPCTTCGCEPSWSSVKRSGNWPELRSDRDWPEAACVIGTRWAAVRPGRNASILPSLVGRHRHTVLRTG